MPNQFKLPSGINSGSPRARELQKRAKIRPLTLVKSDKGVEFATSRTPQERTAAKQRGLLSKERIGQIRTQRAAGDPTPTGILPREVGTTAALPQNVKIPTVIDPDTGSSLSLQFVFDQTMERLNNELERGRAPTDFNALINVVPPWMKEGGNIRGAIKPEFQQAFNQLQRAVAIAAPQEHAGRVAGISPEEARRQILAEQNPQAAALRGIIDAPAQKTTVDQFQSTAGSPIIESALADILGRTDTRTDLENLIADATAPSESLGTTLPATTAAPVPAREQQLEQLFESLLGQLQPTEQEQQLQQALTGQQQAVREGIFNVEQQPIPTPFITGQKAAIEELAGIKTQNIIDQLALAQQSRQTGADVAQARLGFGERALERDIAREQVEFGRGERALERGIQQRQFEESQQLQAVSSGLRYDPQTGEFFKDPSAQAPDFNERLDIEEGLRKEFIKDAEDFMKIRDSFGRIQASAKDPSPAGDLSMIFNYMKMLDPGSVVRESEFANAQTAGPLLERIGLSFDKIDAVWEGKKLTDGQRADFVNRSNQLFRAQETQHEKRVNTFQNLAQGAGVRPEAVIIDIGLASGLGEDAEVTGGQGSSLSPGNIQRVRGTDGQTYQYDISDPAQAAELQEGINAGFFSFQ